MDDADNWPPDPSANDDPIMGPSETPARPAWGCIAAFAAAALVWEIGWQLAHLLIRLGR